MKDFGEDCYSGYIGAPGHEYTQRRRAVVDSEKCGGCLSCVLVCPSKAIVARCVKPVDWVPEKPNYTRVGLTRKEGQKSGFSDVKDLYAE